jgi:hypothetical protein
VLVLDVVVSAKESRCWSGRGDIQCCTVWKESVLGEASSGLQICVNFPESESQSVALTKVAAGFCDESLFGEVVCRSVVRKYTPVWS